MPLNKPICLSLILWPQWGHVSLLTIILVFLSQLNNPIGLDWRTFELIDVANDMILLAFDFNIANHILAEVVGFLPQCSNVFLFVHGFYSLLPFFSFQKSVFPSHSAKSQQVRNPFSKSYFIEPLSSSRNIASKT